MLFPAMQTRERFVTFQAPQTVAVVIVSNVAAGYIIILQ